MCTFYMLCSICVNDILMLKTLTLWLPIAHICAVAILYHRLMAQITCHTPSEVEVRLINDNTGFTWNFNGGQSVSWQS